MHKIIFSVTEANKSKLFKKPIRLEIPGIHWWVKNALHNPPDISQVIFGSGSRTYDSVFDKSLNVDSNISRSWITICRYIGIT